MKVDGEAANPSGLAGEFELGIALGQCEFCQLAIGDVLDSSPQADNLALGITHGRTARSDPDRYSIPERLQLKLVADTRLHRTLHRRLQPFPVLDRIPTSTLLAVGGQVP